MQAQCTRNLLKLRVIFEVFSDRVARDCRAAVAAEAAESFEECAARAAIPEYRRWHRADDRRHELRDVWRQFFATEADVMICPAFSRAAYPHTGDDGAFWPFWRDTCELQHKCPYFFGTFY